MENHSKKILLHSNDPADVTFVSSIAAWQQAEFELTPNPDELFSKMTETSSKKLLSAVFVDVSTPAMLHQFEHAIMTRLGWIGAIEMASKIHYLSSKPLALNRNILLSPYFSFFSERKVNRIAHLESGYFLSFHPVSEFRAKDRVVFAPESRDQVFEEFKKRFLSHQGSTEWLMRFRRPFMDLVENLFNSKFEASFQIRGSTWMMHLSGADSMTLDRIRAEPFLELGVSLMLSQREMVFFIPGFHDLAEATHAFTFLKVEK